MISGVFCSCSIEIVYMENSNTVHLHDEPFNEEVENKFDSMLPDEGEEMTREEAASSPDDLSSAEEEQALASLSARYSTYSRLQLAERLKELLENNPVDKIKDEVESIKTWFYRKQKESVEAPLQATPSSSGQEKLKQQEQGKTSIEDQFKELLARYKELKREFNRQQELIQQANLEKKLKIIEAIKELTTGKEELNETYHKFRDLQKAWRETGPVPPQNTSDLYERYHHTVELFYDFLKINKELKELDLKKNLEQKIQLCEKTEELLLEPSVIKAFRTLQEYHAQWREIGPVPADKREEIWNRFKNASTKINKAYQEYFEKLKEEQKKNLALKTGLCEKAEELAQAEIHTLKEWEEKSKAMVELQQLWRTIGFAPKKDNVKIYERFRAACNEFFNRRKEFYHQIKEEQNKNYQIKLDLCIQAEALKESTDWKKATSEIIKLQKLWKQTGPVPRKHSEALWQRFRTACDDFFNRKAAHFASLENSQENNLARKLALIEEIKQYTLPEDVQEALNALKSFQQRWTEIGFVPMSRKEEITAAYHEAINRLYDQLKVDESKRQLLKFKSKIESIRSSGKPGDKLYHERDKLITRLHKLENDIKLWENNIGFFSKSKNAEKMIQEVQNKIDKAREEIRLLEEKINFIDSVMK